MDSHPFKDVPYDDRVSENLDADDYGNGSRGPLSLHDADLAHSKLRLQHPQTYQDEPPPIHSLPFEVLAEIFFIYAEDNHELFDMGWARRLLLVCKRWRVVGEQTTKLWSFIEIAPRDSKPTVEENIDRDARDVQRIQCQLLHAGQSTLAVRLQTDFGLSTAKQAFLPMFWDPRALRCMELTGDPTYVVKVVDAFHPHQHTAVVDLAINLRYSPGKLTIQKVAHDEIHALLFESALSEIFPNVRNLSTSGLRLNWNLLDVYQLRMLDINLVNAELESSLSTSEILNALSRFPFLSSLSLRFTSTFRPLSRPYVAASLPHIASICIEGASELCAGFLNSFIDVPPTANIVVPMSGFMESRDSESLRSVLSYTRNHALKEGAPVIRTLTLNSTFYLSPIWERIPSKELHIAGLPHVERDMILSKPFPRSAHVAVSLRFGLGQTFLQAALRVIQSWPLANVTHLDARLHPTRIHVAAWETLFISLPAITTLILSLPLGRDNADSFIAVLHTKLRQHRQRVVANIIFNVNSTELVSGTIRSRLTLMRVLLYCADAARLGVPMDTVEVVYDSKIPLAGACFLGHDAADCDCDWSELYKDLREGFIYDGVLHNAAVGSEGVKRDSFRIL
ncbi:hypothetical protein PENSPDRAFT_682500 [Peniophora sp. CONT]|nr:hypothetical protein PENSPDRAFT_682500 [Peniophora sp. CONT]